MSKDAWILVELHAGLFSKLHVLRGAEGLRRSLIVQAPPCFVWDL